MGLKFETNLVKLNCESRETSKGRAERTQQHQKLKTKKKVEMSKNGNSF